MRPLLNDMLWLIRIETQICNLSDITFRINLRKVWNLKRVQWKRGEEFQSHSNKMCYVSQIIVSMSCFSMYFLSACLCLQTHTALRWDINCSILWLNSQLKYKNCEILMILTIVQMLKTLFRPNSACLNEHSYIQMLLTQMGWGSQQIQNLHNHTGFWRNAAQVFPSNSFSLESRSYLID